MPLHTCSEEIHLPLLQSHWSLEQLGLAVVGVLVVGVVVVGVVAVIIIKAVCSNQN